ncbi:MAG: cation transporter [Micavibrio sp.]|nr:cation transporter [Micavibrio sp.]|tara:strand:- start:1124 stop:2341 length:1218 start_codon:yes stop_codon:yes gene_type:complete
MEVYFLIVAIIGFVSLSISWVVYLFNKTYVSYPILFLILGIVFYSTIDALPWVSPFRNEKFTVHLTEIMVIIALMGTGLRLDKPFSISTWRVPFLLVTVTMFLCIISLAAIGYFWLGWGLATAVLIGAVLAPTDPVLAADVQTGPPNSKKDGEVKFSLTAEAGMNDGMAFPFIWLAIGLLMSSQTGDSFFTEWVLKDVLYRLSAGAFIGFISGKAITYLFFRIVEKHNAFEVREGLVALSVALLVYGITELAHGYGFIAVFIAAVTIRNYEMDHEYHQTLHAFIDQIERILIAILLVLFGGSIVDGILDHLTLPLILAAIGFVFLIRPLAGLLALFPLRKMPLKEKLAISFLGIKGIGSFFYLSFALEEASFPAQEELWSFTSLIIIISIFMHGITAAVLIKKAD